MSRIIKGVQVTTQASTIGKKDTSPLTTKTPCKDTKYHILRNHILSNAENKANALIYAAQEQSRSILEEASLEARAIRENAHSEGYSQGYKKGKEEALSLKKKAESIVENARRERIDIINSAEPEIISLALRMAEKIVHRELDLDNSLLLSMLRGIKLGDLGQKIVIRANPKVLPILQAQEKELLLIFPGEGLRLEPDPRVEEGFILDTEMGTIDAGVTSQLKELEKVLREVMLREE